MSGTIDLTNFFNHCGISFPHNVEITETEGMYPFNPDYEANWTYFTFKGYQYLRDKIEPPFRIACVAAGSGIEVIGLNRIFPLASFYLTDIDSEIVSVALKNVKGIFPVPKFTALTGSLCEPLIESGLKFDLIHGNVPNLICNDDKDLSSGDDKGTFIKSGILSEQIPEEYIKWGLGTQYEYLRGAYEVLNPGGSVVTMIGGRFPLRLVEKLFSDCKLKLESEFSVGFKWQTQPEPDFIGYRDLEKKMGAGESFDFYVYDLAIEILEKKGFLNPTSILTGQEMKDLLSSARVSATYALTLHRKGIRCGHTVHLFRGVRM
jgi:hypothetical protein